MGKFHSAFRSIGELRAFLILWAGQAFSALGSAMTAYALVIWSYRQEGSALTTALLMVSSYTPYILLSVFAGAFSDRWNKKKTMLVCDSAAALTTVAVLALLQAGRLAIWHIYLINAVNGLMNSVQRPASEVAVTRVLPPRYYQRVGGLRYLASSFNSLLTPIAATALLGLFGLPAVIYFDLITFAAASLSLLLWVKIPEDGGTRGEKEPFWASVGTAVQAMGLVNAVIGGATLAGSLAASLMKAPKSRVRVICNCLLFAMSTENLMLALGRSPWVWCLAGFLGWIAIPTMNANLDVIFRQRIPAALQGRVYAVRNALQFFTIPTGYFLGGLGVDAVCEPIMAAQQGGPLTALFGQGKGSGAALFFFLIAWLGIAVCLIFRRNRHLWALESNAQR